MKTHEFAFVASGLDPLADGFEDRLFEAGCDDATISLQKGMIILEFTREAPTFFRALRSAYADACRAGVKVERIEPDSLVSLSDIARRSGLTRAAVHLYHKGERSKDFPAPVVRVTSDSPLWDWCEVSRWLAAHDRVDRAVVIQARLVREANRTLQARDIHPHHIMQRLEEAVAREATQA